MCRMWHVENKSKSKEQLMAHETVHPMTDGQQKDLIATMVCAMPALTSDEAQAIIGAKGQFIADIRVVYEKRKSVVTKMALFEPIGTVVIPVIFAPFAAQYAFVTNPDRSVDVKVAWLGSNFKEWFLNKIEGPIAESTLRYAKLLKSSLDTSILEELGEVAESTLGQIFYLISCQPKGEEGVLLNNGWANIFYVMDAYGVLRAVRVDWYVGGWRVGACLVDGMYGWYGGCRFFSRSS